MAANKPPVTHRAYCVLREGGRRRPGRWIETGAATADPEGWLMVHLENLPVSGFDGYVLLRPIDAKLNVPLPPEPDDDGVETGGDDVSPARMQ
jgi:hypothetical protein